MSASEIELLPNRFVALLERENSQPQFYFIEKKGDDYFYFKDKIPTAVSKQQLGSRWKNTVLLIEKSETDTIAATSTSKLLWFLPFLSVLLFLCILVQFNASLQDKIFFIFPILGFLFSVVALKDLFGTKSELLNNFCNMTVSTSCETVVGSSKWKILEIVNFSDLGMVFFCSQFVGLLVFLFSNNTTAYFEIQQLLLLGSLPVLFASIYYQKFVERMWCPICLVIVGIILLELGYMLFLYQINFEFTIQTLIVFGFVFVTIALIWSVLKKLLTQQKELKEFQIKGNRFIRNYEVFKNTLLASTPIENNPIQSGIILLGNIDAPLKITVVTSPFCSFCAEAHTIIEEILQKHSETVCFDIRFNFNEANSDEKSKKVHQELLAIYYDQGQKAFVNALHDWFDNKDENKLDNLGIFEWDESMINEILKEQFQWNQANDLTYTPAILINQYIFPKQYDRKDLIHFINDLSDDEDFNK